MLRYLRNFLSGGKVRNNAPHIKDTWSTRGDQWESQAWRMLGKPLVKIRLDGCMASVECLEAEGVCDVIIRNPDPYGIYIIWEASATTSKGETFKVIVARCSWNAKRGRWEEKY